MQRLLISALSAAVCLGLGLTVPAGTTIAASSGGSSGSSSSSGGSSSSSTSSTSVSALYTKAKSKVDAKDYRGAMPILDKIIAKDPGNADALNLMGFCSRKLGDPKEGLEYYEKALKINPNHVGANEYLGELYLEMKDLPKAEERLKVLAKACNGCEEQHELEKAISDYKAKNS